MSESLTKGGTIAAIATAIVPQQGSVGIVRVSGSKGRGYLVISLRRVLIPRRSREKRSLELGIQAVVRSFD